MKSYEQPQSDIESLSPLDGTPGREYSSLALVFALCCLYVATFNFAREGGWLGNAGVLVCTLFIVFPLGRLWRTGKL